MINRFRLLPLFVRRLRERAVSPEEVLRRAGLPAVLARDPKAMLTTEQFFAFWDAVGEVSGDPTIGLTLGADTRVEQLDVVSLTALSAASFRDALARAGRYKQLTCPEEIQVATRGGEAAVRFRWLRAGTARSDVLTDICFSWVAALADRGTGGVVRPIRVELAGGPRNRRAYVEHFRCPVQVNARGSALFFSAADLDRPFQTHNADLLGMLTPQLDAELATRQTSDDARDQVKAVLRRSLAGHRPGLRDVARELASSPRTLQRRLGDLGVSYHQMVEEARRDLARHYLVRPELELAEIAYLLGTRTRIRSSARSESGRAHRPASGGKRGEPVSPSSPDATGAAYNRRMARLRLPFLSVPLAAVVALTAALSGSTGTGLQSPDLYALQSIGDVQASPDGTHVAYTVQHSDRPGRPTSRLWVMHLQSRRNWRVGPDGASGPRWSPDGRRLAFLGRHEDESSLVIANPDGKGVVALAPVRGTNHSLPSTGDRISWSPDGAEIAFVSATDGPEEAYGDPVVITRYLYKPPQAEGTPPFNDNRRLHIFIVKITSRAVRQLTTGNYYEHSIDWSPRGDEILFLSNREADPERVFNYDVFTANVASGAVRRLTETKSAEYRPTWSPDGKMIAYQGTTRPLTSSETTMEDTHVWVMDADGRNRREAVAVDNRQGAPSWSADGAQVYFTVQEKGSTRLYRQPLAGGTTSTLTPEDGSIGAWSLTGKDAIVYAFTGRSGPADLHVRSLTNAAPASSLTSLNEKLLSGRTISEVEAFTFRSFDGRDVEAFLTHPLNRQPSSRHPLIVMIHGGPHGQQGPAFNAKAQVYASQGWAALMVNYRGSTGYGQKFADAIFRDQNGGEAKDVLAGVDAALTRYPWLDGERMGIEGGSYGGQLTNWIVTQTERFRAAVPAASISNLVSLNYMSYYHDYLAVEFGSHPHENNLMDLLWERSALRYVHKVRTPVMFVHGEEDNNVPIAEAEQFFIALMDVGVETVMVRYPREGHGVRETKHAVDVIDRSIAWYKRHFERGSR